MTLVPQNTSLFSSTLDAAQEADLNSPPLLAPPGEPVLWRRCDPFRTERNLRLPIGTQRMVVWHVSDMATGRRMLSLRSRTTPGAPHEPPVLSTQFRPAALQWFGRHARFAGAVAGEHPNYRGFWMLDEPRLSPARELLMGPFRPAAVTELDALIERTCSEVLTERIPRSSDVFDIAEYSNDVLFRLMAYLLGAKPENAPAMASMFRRWMHTFNSSSSLASLRWQPGIYWALSDMIRHHDGTPGILADVQAARKRRDTLGGERPATLADYIGLVWALIAAGTDTPGTVATQTVWFALNAGLWRPKTTRESQQLVMESLRYYPPFTRPLARFTRECEIQPGVVAQPGEWVELHLPAMNRDATVFDHPDTFDVDRADAAAARTFGGGAHRCIGNHYGTTVDAMIIQTLSELRLGVLRGHRYTRHAGLLHRLEELPLAFAK